MTTIGKDLRALRIRRGMKQDELGRRVGKGRGTVGSYELDKVPVTAEILEKLLFEMDYSWHDWARIRCGSTSQETNESLIFADELIDEALQDPELAKELLATLSKQHRQAEESQRLIFERLDVLERRLDSKEAG